MINESADLFETRERPRSILDDDLIEVLGARLERLIERHRATQRAVAELREALAVRDRRIVELDAKLAASERAREPLVERIDALIAEVDRMIQRSEGEAPESSQP